MKNIFIGTNEELHCEDMLNRGNLAKIYLELDFWNETVDIVSRYSDNSTSILAWNGHEKNFVLSWLFDADEGSNWLEENIMPIAEQIFAEYESKWDGSNYVGTFTQKGHELLNSIGMYGICEIVQPELHNVMFFRDWIEEDEELKSLKEQEVENYVTECLELANSDYVFIVDDENECYDIAKELWQEYQDRGDD